MDRRAGDGADFREVGSAVAAYLVFALSAGLSVRSDGSTRWPVVAIGMLAFVLAVALLIVPVSRRR